MSKPINLREQLYRARELLNQNQVNTRQHDHEEPSLFAPGDLVWLENRRRKKGGKAPG